MKRETKPTHSRVTRSQTAALKEAKADDGDGDDAVTQKHDLGFILNERARKEAALSKVELSKEEKKRGRMCKAPDCTNYIVHKGLCCRHGVSMLAQCDILICDMNDRMLHLLACEGREEVLDGGLFIQCQAQRAMLEAW